MVTIFHFTVRSQYGLFTGWPDCGETHMPAWQWLVAACREEANARTAENLQKLRDMILELESDRVAVEILLKTMEIGTDHGIGLCSRKLLPKSSDVGEGGQQAGRHPAAGKGHPVQRTALACLKQEPSRASSAAGSS